MKKIQLDISVAGGQVIHGAVKKRLSDLEYNANQAGQAEKALLQEADRELSDALQKAMSRPEQDG